MALEDMAKKMAAGTSVTRDELLELLQDVTPEVRGGKVILPDCSLPDGCEAYLDVHPDGHDRGGYVPYVKSPSGGLIYYEEDNDLHGPWMKIGFQD